MIFAWRLIQTPNGWLIYRRSWFGKKYLGKNGFIWNIFEHGLPYGVYTDKKEAQIMCDFVNAIKL